MSSSTNRSPQARVLRNDERILDAAISILADAGWGAFNVAAVARRANLSHPAVKDRFPGRPEAARRIWEQRLGPIFVERMAPVLTLAREDRNAVTATEMHEAFASWLHPDANLLAIAELLVGAHHDGVLRDAMDVTLGAPLREACTPAGTTSATMAAQRAYLAILAFGFTFLAHRTARRQGDYSREFEAIADALAHPTKPRDLPATERVTTLQDLVFDAGHEEHDALLRATLELVAKHGYHEVTIDDFARAVGVTKGFVFARYESKAQLFLDASSRQRTMSLQANLDQIAAIAAEHGNGVAEAATIQKLQHPNLSNLRALDLEQLQLIWHDDTLAANEDARLEQFATSYATRRPDASPEQVEAHVNLSRAAGLGIDMLPVFVPSANELPYDTITVPLHERPTTTN